MWRSLAGLRGDRELIVSDHKHDVTSALILAAGNGKRLRSQAPKPTYRLLGVPLLARTLFSLERAGITDAYVVLGYEAELVRREIERVDGLNVHVHWLYNERWRQPNGLSALQAESVLDGPFILTMADHIFDPSVVRTLREKASDLKGIDLAVDYNIDRVVDLDDATKVQVACDRIVAIGKTLTSYDAIDTGVFLASPVLFETLHEASAAGRASLSDGVQRLADAGMARVTDIGDRMWQDIDTPADVAEAGRRLLVSVRKSTDGPIARYINRPISTVISRLLVRTRVTPNQISISTLGISLLAAGIAAVGGYTTFLVGGILFQLASILDGADGEVAKLTFRTSRRGEWIDTACDQASYVVFLIGLLIGVYRSPVPDIYFRLGVLGLVSASLSMASISIYLMRQKGSGSALAIRYGFQDGSGLLSRVLRAARSFGRRDMFAFLVFALAVVGQLPFGLALFGLGSTFLLLPVTVKANLTLGQPTDVRPPTGPRTIQQPSQDPAWVTAEAAQAVSETPVGVN